uniref:NACHT LRR and PYD domain-containing protein n=1 Tax=Neolamprologus brichardi TaxID=32507 RepID=A0A3Q4GIV3_NEOBR
MMIKLYCFVHLTVQEYFAALFLKSILETVPVDLPLNELIEITIANSAPRTTGELDMFLRFLIGLSLQSTQDLLQGLIQQTEEHSANIEEIRSSLLDIDLLDCSAERCLNLVHCLTELKDSSLHDSVRKYLKPNCFPESPLSPVECSALADLILMSNTPLDEFNIKKYRPSERGITNLKKISCIFSFSLSHNKLTEKGCETLASLLSFRASHLKDLDLSYNDLQDSGVIALCNALTKPQCGLKTLRLSFCKVTQRGGSSLVSALDSNYCSLKDLDLSFNNLSEEVVKLLNQKKRDTCCSLENVKYGKKSCLKKNNLIYYQFFSHFNIARSIIVLRKQQCFCLFFPLVWTTMKNVGSI